MKKLSQLSEGQLAKLVDNRWNSSDSVWDIVEKTYAENLKVYKNEPSWLEQLPRKKSKVRANRIFVDTEAVINSLIANLPKPTIIPGRDTPESKELAQQQEKYFQIKYEERNVKEAVRKALRNLYFSRLLVLKPYWDPKINDFNVRALDPRKVRLQKNCVNEQSSEFAIEEITDNLLAVLNRFPKKRKELLEHFGFTEENEEEVLVQNPEVKYKEAWIRDHVIFKLDSIILGVIRNPYWDWDGLLMTPEEEEQLKQATAGEGRRNILAGVRNEQTGRKQRMAQNMAAMQAQQGGAGPVPSPLQPTPAGNIPPDQWPTREGTEEMDSYQAYYFNHFDNPRKPYIIATVFNNENSPIGQTDMITQATPLQEDVDSAKRDISENAKHVNGITKVDSTVMDKADAQRLRYEVGGVIWGKGAVAGVARETGTALPNFVVENMIDSRREIDEIMAASSAFKGTREGQETKGGRLGLIEQSFLRLNELVQVVDYTNYELFNWFYQLGKVRYTEHHYAKILGKEKAVQLISLYQDDFEDGTEIRVIGGKTLPEDRQFKYEQAQGDVKEGLLSPVDYFEIAGYESPAEKAKNRVEYDINKPLAVGISPEELQKIATDPQSEPPKLSLSYTDLPPDGKVQLAAKAGIQLDPRIVVAEEMKQHQDKKAESDAKTAALNKPPVAAKK